MGDNNEGPALAMETPKQFYDFASAFGIKVRSRLISQNELRIVDKRSGNGHPLALPAGELVRAVMGKLRNSHLSQR